MKKSRFYYSKPCYTTTIGLMETEEGFAPFHLPYSIMSPMSRITICGVLDTEANTLSFGAAVCSTKDRFCKKIGRELAEKRALETPMLVENVPTKEDTPGIFMDSVYFLELYLRETTDFRCLTKLIEFEEPEDAGNQL